MDNDRERPAQIQHINTQTNFESQKFHVRDTTNFLQDDFKTRKCLSGPPTRRPRGFQTPKKYPGRASGAPRCTVRAALRHHGASPRAAQARYCKPPEREHHFHRPARSTLYRSTHAAPRALRLVLSPTTLSFSHLIRLTSLPPRRTHGVGGFDWAAPTAAAPKRESSGQQCRERPAQILLTRQMVKPKRIMPATPQPASKTTEDPKMPQQISEKSLSHHLEQAKIPLGELRVRPGAPSQPPSDAPRSSPEPPRRD